MPGTFVFCRVLGNCVGTCARLGTGGSVRARTLLACAGARAAPVVAVVVVSFLFALGQTVLSLFLS